MPMTTSGMARPLAFLLRLGLLAAATALIGAATVSARSEPVRASALPGTAPAQPKRVVVPDVRGQAYVFAKGILQDSGFAWHVAGRIHGYAGDVVTTKNPTAGTQ